MSRYIDAEWVVNNIRVFLLKCDKEKNGLFFFAMDALIKLLDDAPTVDAVQVVRCKDCKYWICEEQIRPDGEKIVRCAVDDERWTGGNDFCSFGTKFVHGHWVEDPENETIVCSNCGQKFGLEFKIDVCMNCYAKMDGKEE